MDYRHVILKYIDRAARLLIFTYDQVGGFIGIFVFLTTVFNSPEFGIIFGMMFVLSLPSFKKKLGGGTMKHLLYWYCPTNPSSMPYPIPSYIRELIG